MKRQLFTALFLTVATVVIAPSAKATESKAIENIQATRLDILNTQTKAVDNIQATRLDHLNRQSKAVKDIQAARLERLDAQTKSNLR